jgi:hypothetical protein
MFNSIIEGLKGLFGWRIKPQDAPPDTTPGGSYGEKLLKYIPADIVAGWVALSGILVQSASSVPWWLGWAVFGALLLLTPFYVCYIKTTPPGLTSNKIFHWVTACVAFSAWVFALGTAGPFGALAWYRPVYGSVVLVIVTLTIPVTERFFVKTPAAGNGTGGNSTGPGGPGSGSPPSGSGGTGPNK